MKTVFEKVFQLSKHKTTAKTEVMAGITTFMTMAYILAVNPSVLSAAGMDATAVLLATALSSFIGTACMALMANLPFALSAGMGLNAFLAYTVVLGMGYTWQVALLAVFVEGLIFVVLSLTNVREAIFNAIPLTLKRGVSVGIGLFICFIGLQNAGLAVDSATLVTITSFTENFSTHGICALLALIGLFIMAALYLHHVRGAILLGILAAAEEIRPLPEDAAFLRRVMSQLLRVRAARTPPTAAPCVLTEDCALAATVFALCGRRLGEARYIQLAQRAVGALTALSPGLPPSYTPVSALNAQLTCGAGAALALALLTLGQAEELHTYRESGLRLLGATLHAFTTPDGLPMHTPQDAAAFFPRIPAIWDSELPSPAALLLHALALADACRPQAGYKDAALVLWQAAAPYARQQPLACAGLIDAAHFTLSESREAPP